MLKSVLFSMLYLIGSISAAFADGPAAPAGMVPAGSPVSAPLSQPINFMSQLPMFAGIFAVVYFLMIRPQQKKMKEQQDMLGGLKHGDDILTQSGILGKVTGITDKVVTVEVADNVRVKMMKSQVSQIIKGQIKDLA